MTKSRNIYPPRKPWTLEEEEKLKELSKTLVMSQLMKEFNRTHAVIKWKLRTLGLTTRAPWVRPIELKRKIYKYLEKYGYKKTCAQYNLTYRQVTKIKYSYLKKIKKIQEQRDPEALDKLRRYAIRFALKRRCTVEDAEDFGTHVVVKQIELGNTGIDLNFLFINWSEEKHRVRNKRDVLYDEKLYFCNKEETGLTREKQDFLRTIEDIQFPYRVILILKFIFNFSHVDIGIVLGVSESRISQQYKQTLNELKVNIKFNRKVLPS